MNDSSGSQQIFIALQVPSSLKLKYELSDVLRYKASHVEV